MCRPFGTRNSKWHIVPALKLPLDSASLPFRPGRLASITILDTFSNECRPFGAPGSWAYTSAQGLRRWALLLSALRAWFGTTAADNNKNGFKNKARFAHESGLVIYRLYYRGLPSLFATVFALSVALLLLVVAWGTSAFSFAAVGSAATFTGSESALIFTEARTLCSLAKLSFFSTCESEPSAFFSGAFTASVNS